MTCYIFFRYRLPSRLGLFRICPCLKPPLQEMPPQQEMHISVAVEAPATNTMLVAPAVSVTSVESNQSVVELELTPATLTVPATELAGCLMFED